MSDCQHRRWIGFVALALPLYLAGCASTTPPPFPLAEEENDIVRALGIERSGSRYSGTLYLAGLPSTATDFPTAAQDRSSPQPQSPVSTAAGDVRLSQSESAVAQDSALSEASLPPQPSRSAVNRSRWQAIPLPTPSTAQSAARPVVKEAAAPNAGDTPAAPAVAVPPILTMEVESGPGTPIYHVQLAAYRRKDQAEAGWERLTAAAASLLGDLKPLIRRVDLGPDKGVFFRLQTGLFTEHTDATSLCRNLLARGIDCLVVKVLHPEVPRESAMQRRYATERVASSPA